jgi:hypothetical protein
VDLALLLPFYLGFTLKNGIIVAIFVCGKGIKKELFLEDSFERFFVDEKWIGGYCLKRLLRMVGKLKLIL